MLPSKKTFLTEFSGKRNLTLLLLLCWFFLFSMFTAKMNAQSTVPYQWKNVKIGGGGFVTGIITCPTKKDLIYIRTDVGGAYRWNATYNSWIPLLDWVSPDDWLLLGVESIAIDPSDPNCLYMACGMYAGNNSGEFLRSKDQGDHFQRSGNITPMGGNDMGRSNGERLAVDPNKGNVLLFGSRRGGLWNSSDSSKTWKQLGGFPVSTTSNGVGINFVKFIKSSGSSGKATPVIYAGVSRKGDNNIYTSADTGKTWQAVAGQPTDLMPQHCAIDSDTALYITYSDTEGPYGISSGKVWRYSRNSGKWTDITPSGRNQGGFGGVSVDLQHPGTVMVSTMNDYSPHDLVFRSTNSGTSWVELLSNGVYDYMNFPLAKTNNVHWTGDFQIDPYNSDHVLFTTGYGLWSSFDATKADQSLAVHWQFADNGIEETVPLELVSPPSGDANLLSANGDFDGFRHDKLDTFATNGRFAPNYGTNSSIDFAEKNPSIVARAADGKGYYSNDGGKSWTVFGTLPSTASKGYIAVAADGSSIVWAPENQAMYYTRNLGASWAVSSGAPIGSKPIADRSNANIFYIYKGGLFYRSIDGGATFGQTVSVGTGGGFARTVPGIEGDIWVPLGGNGLKHSTDNGNGFTPIATVQEVYAIGFGRHAPKKNYPAIFIYGKINNLKAIYRSDDKCTTWVKVNDDQHQYGGYGNAVMTGDSRIFGRVYISTGGRGIVYGQPLYDCSGVLNGAAYYDKCDSCVGGNTGKTECVPSAVTTLRSMNDVSFSPNPFVTSMRMQTVGECNYSIINLQGKLVESGTCKGECLIGAYLVPGIFILKVENKNEAQTFEIIKQP